MKKLLFLTALIALSHTLMAKDYYISTSGNDKHNGSETKPFKSFAKAISKLKSGDVLTVEQGHYFEPIVLKGGQNKFKKPVTIKARAGAIVVMNGSDSLENAPWLHHKNGIYKAKLKQPISQLFDGDKILTPARWPNAQMTDDNFFNLKETNRMLVHGKSPLGSITDARPIQKTVNAKRVTESQITGLPIRDGYNTQSLSEAGFSAEGAIAVMNIGSWMNFTSRIIRHKAGENSFDYDADFLEAGKAMKTLGGFLKPGKKFQHFLAEKPYWHPHYYFIEGLAALDVENEYWYDKDSKTLYYKPAGGQLNPKNIRGKRRSYMLDASNCNNVTFDGLNFFSATFKIAHCTNTTLKNANLFSPSWNEFQLGNLGKFPVTEMINNPKAGDTGNIIQNISASYLDGEAIIIRGMGTKLENCLFHDLQYTMMGFAVAAKVGGAHVSRCTLYNSGAPEGFRDGLILEKNRVTAIGGLSHDGSALQMGNIRTPSVIRYNWVHDTTKLAYRYDSGKNPPVTNGFGMVHNNVAWNTGRTQIKGDDFIISNNTLLGQTASLNLNTAPWWNSTNIRTVAANNIYTSIDGRPKMKKGSPGLKYNNVIYIKSLNMLRDPLNYDFRPKVGSALIGTGKVMTPVDVSAQFPKTSYPLMPTNKRQVVGAYAANDNNYLIPGFQYQQASTPIPRNYSTTAQPDADLMWLTGYQSVNNHIYLGNSKQSVADATLKSSEYKGNQHNNIYHPGAITANTHYYWRIDSVKADGTVVKGNIWQFKRDVKPL